MRAIGMVAGVLLVLGFPTAAFAITWHVPSQFSTIQAAVDAASAGDTVLVACGTYDDCTHLNPDGRLSCVIMKSGVVLRSATGESDCATIDAQLQGRCVYANSVVNASMEGFTVTGGYVLGYPGGHGAGLYCLESSLTVLNCSFVDNWARHLGAGAHCFGMPAATFLDCMFLDNTAEDDGGGMVCWFSDVSVLRCTFLENWGADHGGAVLCNQSSMSMVDCVMARNTAGHWSGAVTCWDCSPTISGCTIVDNRAGGSGGGVGCFLSSSPKIENTIIAFSSIGEAVYCHNAGCSPSLACCDLHGNAGGDWVGCVAGQNGTNGNFSENPAFCGWAMGDYTLRDCSPCVEGYGCGQIGALGIGCTGPTVTESTSWSGLKALYR